MELLQRFEEMGNTTSKPVELPHKHTGKLMMACRSHQRLELRSAFFATGDGNIKVLGHNLQAGTYGVTSETIGLEIRLLMDRGDTQVKSRTHETFLEMARAVMWCHWQQGLW